MSSDTALVEQGESTDEVADLAITQGVRAAQEWMLEMGYGGWRKTAGPITWLGGDLTTGGQYYILPTDFMRAVGNGRISALRQNNGDPWGLEMDWRDEAMKGPGYYIRGAGLNENVYGTSLNAGNAPILFLTRLPGDVPSPLYFHYHYMHPEWSDALGDGNIDFPMRARALIVAEAAYTAKEENWLPGGPEMEEKIERALQRARERARRVARQTKRPRQILKPRRMGNHW